MVNSRRPAVRAGVLLLISLGLWACAGCTSTGPADKSEAEVPARPHCTPLSGDPLPSMCAPHGRTTGTASGRAAVPDRAAAPAAPREGRATRDAGPPPPSDATRDTGGTVPATADEPVSPELMPEAPFSAWGVPVPWQPEAEEPAGFPPVVLEHAAETVPPATEEPAGRYEETAPPGPAPTPAGTAPGTALDA
ncbi:MULTISPECIES: hypothetical protein [Catenuloplanes]|uniref:Uncharacterized protein n=1 Tax=Catenuloplanes niger TaxID=587534 RepID=A0AAE3ZJH3_9ACTN|nr:hypothetical protein [Catenuloplanes niger]MDR7319794.1 hypothetical protein [Catenuloplanes niger]